MKKLLLTLVFVLCCLSITAQEHSCSFHPYFIGGQELLYTTVRIGDLVFKDCLIDTGASYLYLTSDDLAALKKAGIITSKTPTGKSTTKLVDESKALRMQYYKLKGVTLEGARINKELIVIFDTANPNNKARLIGKDVLDQFSSFSYNKKDNTFTLYW